MKIVLRSLKEGSPKAVREEYNPKDLDLEFVDLIYLVPVKMSGMVEKVANTLTFRGELASRVEHVCARCLEHVEEEIEYPFELVYDITGKEELETLEDLREMLILNHPIRFLCREDCPGLCPRCGGDLAKGGCSCKN